MAKHTWRFFRAGGFDQVKLETGADLVALGDGQLDQKLWVALACPVKGLEFDEKTLALLDEDGDGRIRAPEIVGATKWACSMLKDPGSLIKSGKPLPISAINDKTDEGKAIVASAKQILSNLGKDGAPGISVDAAGDTTKVFEGTNFNGDGVIPADAAGDDEDTKKVIEQIIECVGSADDRSGKQGINQEHIDTFFAEAQAFADWTAGADADGVSPLGDDTGAAYDAVEAVKAKVDDYFARCRLAAYDERALGALNRQEAEYLAVAAEDMKITVDEVAPFPVALIEANKPLPLSSGVNPAWVGAIEALRDKAVIPIAGKKKSTLNESEWGIIKDRLAPYGAWLGAKAGAKVEALGVDRVLEILAGNTREAVDALMARDKELEDEANSITAVNKLVRLYRDLHTLLENFVNFRKFYAREKSNFQTGTLYLDQRSCDLCVRVDDSGKHGKLAGLAKTYLAYCDCVRPSTKEKRTIAAAFTGGDSDNLMVGRNGIFYDRDGNDWDATITKIIDNPISIPQAFWSPYKRFVRMIEMQAAKRAAAAEAESQKSMDAAAVATASGKPAPPAKKIDVGTVAAMGVAVGA
ncbi:MAG: hypothetical protein ACYTFT_15300, partial [Planctomycetota bacterium]